MTVKTRFAPSPTGLLHVGNARTALITWLFSRHEGGQFLLRLDDTDAERSEARFTAAIHADLMWLGLAWDLEARQSERWEVYEDRFQALKREGRLYPCYETAEELSLRRTVQLQQGRPPIYDRAALRLGEAERARLEAEGRRPHWRFRLEHEAIVWDDLVRGPVRFEGADLSDPVVIRADGRPLYHLCSVIDDADFGITHVIRGEDHVANTATHVQMFQALGEPVPGFAHLPLVADAEGRGLSKRIGSLSLESLREEEGLEPMAIANVLARLGTSQPVEAFTSLAPLVESFDFRHFARATPKLDPAEFNRVNRQIVHGLPFEAVAARLEALGCRSVDAAFWEAVRPNLEKLGEAADWWTIARGEIAPMRDDPGFLDEAAGLLPPEPWGPETWKDWTQAVKAATGRKGRDLFRPLRLALTGLDHGPEMAQLLPLIGRARALARLTGQR